MECPQCGKAMAEGQAFCSWCGSPVGKPKPAEAPSSNGTDPNIVKCPGCSARNKSTSQFCWQCGRRLRKFNTCPDCVTPLLGNEMFCPKCGKGLSDNIATKPVHRPIATLLFSMIPGLFSIWGIGQFMNGRIEKGILFLIIGLLFSPFAGLGLIMVGTIELDIVLAYILWLFWIGIWIYQSLDAYWDAGGD